MMVRNAAARPRSVGGRPRYQRQKLAKSGVNLASAAARPTSYSQPYHADLFDVCHGADAVEYLGRNRLVHHQRHQRLAAGPLTAHLHERDVDVRLAKERTHLADD